MILFDCRGRQIQIGDLVQIIAPTHCGHTKYLGLIFIAKDFEYGPIGCAACYHQWNSLGFVLFNENKASEPHRLRIIPPLSELSTVKIGDKRKIGEKYESVSN